MVLQLLAYFLKFIFFSFSSQNSHKIESDPQSSDSLFSIQSSSTIDIEIGESDHALNQLTLAHPIGNLYSDGNFGSNGIDLMPSSNNFQRLQSCMLTEVPFQRPFDFNRIANNKY